MSENKLLHVDGYANIIGRQNKRQGHSYTSNNWRPGVLASRHAGYMRKALAIWARTLPTCERTLCQVRRCSRSPCAASMENKL